MKALTVWQPWATLISLGAKPYEFRGRRPPRSIVGTRIAIHAGARPVRLSEVEELLNRIESGDKTACLRTRFAVPLLICVRSGLLAKQRRATFFSVPDEPQPFELPLGAVVCTAVVGPGKAGNLCAEEFGCPRPEIANDSDRPGTFNYGWPLTEIVPLIPPQPARGGQGIWVWCSEPPRQACWT